MDNDFEADNRLAHAINRFSEISKVKPGQKYQELAVKFRKRWLLTVCFSFFIVNFFLYLNFFLVFGV